MNVLYKQFFAEASKTTSRITLKSPPRSIYHNSLKWGLMYFYFYFFGYNSQTRYFMKKCSKQKDIFYQIIYYFYSYHFSCICHRNRARERQSWTFFHLKIFRTIRCWIMPIGFCCCFPFFGNFMLPVSQTYKKLYSLKYPSLNPTTV